MAIEEGTLALLEEGRLASLHTEEARQARYRSEDDAHKTQRAAEDHLREQGESVREAKKAEMEAAIAARAQTPEAQISEQNARIAKLEALIEAQRAIPEPVVVHQPDPVVPVAADEGHSG